MKAANDALEEARLNGTLVSQRMEIDSDDESASSSDESEGEEERGDESSDMENDSSEEDESRTASMTPTEALLAGLLKATHAEESRFDNKPKGKRGKKPRGPYIELVSQEAFFTFRP